jgi:hypothetical protein
MVDLVGHGASSMALHHTTASVAISIACLAVAAVLSIPAAHQFLTRLRAKSKQYTEVADRYEDKDGVATEESEDAYSDFLPRLILLLISLVACGVGLASAILTTTRSHLPLSLEQWLQFATWVRHCFTSQSARSRCLTYTSCWSCFRPLPYTLRLRAHNATN